MKTIKNFFKLNLGKNSLISSSIIILLIVFIPYLLYAYKYFPTSETWNSPFGPISIGYFKNVQLFCYYLFGKIVPLLLFFIWFVTNKNWWYHSIIIPISVYMFQFISILNDTLDAIDEMEFIYTVPITAIVVTILYFIRGQLVIYLEAMDLKKEMEQNFK
ncbi:MAG: hypothetical protein COB60_09400 [Flavobacteriaceae bacterium]|nr:MAG: hypothetical protein COB60_09400 [Flavobacteriaceae bacterium]